MIHDWLELPKNSQVNQVVFKNAFFTLDFFRSQEQDIFTREIEKILWKSAIKKDTLLLKIFEDEIERYREIHILQVELRTCEHYKMIHKLLQRAVAFPLIVCFSYQSKVAFGGALKEYSHLKGVKKILEESITVFEDVSYYADFEKYLAEREGMKNLKEFYMLIYHGIKAQCLFEKTETFEVDERLEERQAALMEREKLEKEIELLKKRIAKEGSLSKKVNLGLELQKLKNKFK